MSKIACLLVIILELLGFRISIADRKWKIFAYYTQISNLITLASSLIFLFTDSAPWLRYTSACMLTMTFIVTACILAPFGGGFRNLLLSGNGLYHHTLCPVLSVISYLFWEPHSSAWGIPVAITFLYGITMLFMNWRGRFDGPYPFFRVNHQSVTATIVWIIILFAVISVISLLLGAV
jgi:hypothetical protein